MRDIRKLLFITGVATVTPVIIQARDKLPNIVIFFMDDMGYGDLTVTGASGYNTPTIDRLASEGMFFTHFYAAQPISRINYRVLSKSSGDFGGIDASRPYRSGP